MKSTPETDKAMKYWPSEDSELVHSDFARRLENERDEARFLLKAAQSALDAIYLEVGTWIKTMKENTD